MANALPTYRGFSTQNFLLDRSKGFRLTNQELVKQDLLNHIYTIPGERVHMPNFGTRIPLLAFEPLDERTLGMVRDDLTKVFNYDPRVNLIDLSVNALPDQNMIVVFADLMYVEINIQETFKLEFTTS